MRIVLLLLSLLSVLCFSCISNTNNFEVGSYSSAIQLDIPNVKDSTFIRYSDLYQSVKYVALKNSDNNVIGYINKLEVTENEDFIVFDKKNKIIARFDSTGTFKNLIGERGHSNREYIEPFTIAYDKYENQVLVWDNGKRSILFYSLDGTYLHTVKLNTWIKNLYVLDEKHLIFFFDYTLRGNGWNYIVAKKDGSYCSAYEDISGRKELKINPDCTNIFHQGDGNDIYCQSPYSCIIYRVNSENATAQYYLSPKEGTWRLGTPKEINSSVKKKNAHEVKFLNLTNNHFFFNISINGIIYLYVTDFKKDSFAGLIAINDIDNYPGTTTIAQAKKNKVYLTFDPSSFENHYNKRKDDEYTTDEQKRFLKEMSQNVNPIIQICTLK